MDDIGVTVPSRDGVAAAEVELFPLAVALNSAATALLPEIETPWRSKRAAAGDTAALRRRRLRELEEEEEKAWRRSMVISFMGGCTYSCRLIGRKINTIDHNVLLYS